MDEVAPFTSKAGSVRLDSLDEAQHSAALDAFRDDEDIYLESTANLKLIEIFGTNHHALYSCLAKELYGGSSRCNVERVVRRCDEWREQHQATMKRARSMAKYMGCGGRPNENELHLTVMVLADAFMVRIKVYTYDDHISPNNDELVTLWADYCGNTEESQDEKDIPLIRLAKLRNAFGILHSEEEAVRRPLLGDQRESDSNYSTKVIQEIERNRGIDVENGDGRE